MRIVLNFIKWGVISVAGLFCILVVIGFLVGKDDQQNSASTAAVASVPATPPKPRALSVQERMQTMMPSSQSSLIAAVETARQQYASAANDMAKGATRPMRARLICAALRNTSVEGWIGRVTTLSTNGDGKGVLGIEIGPDTFVKTWNNSLSDIADNTLIDPSSSLFGVAVQLRTGQLVRFSGMLFQDNTDCMRESSMSLGGSIRKPEFIFRFRSLATVD